MTLTTVKTTALSGTITNAQLAGSIDLTAKVTGTLPTGNGGTGSTATTFVNVASNVTGTLPVANGGTAITSGFINGTATPGKVNQYVFAMENNPQTINSTGSFATLTNVAATITPSATDSKILIFVNTNAYLDFGQGWYVNINRAISGGATTQIFAESDKSTYIEDGSSSSAKLFVTSPITTQDTSHSTTSACTYQVGIRTTGEIYMNNNRQSSITVVEVLA